MDLEMGDFPELTKWIYSIKPQCSLEKRERDGRVRDKVMIKAEIREKDRKVSHLWP